MTVTRLDAIFSRFIEGSACWPKCPRCGERWRRLRESGLCITCDPEPALKLMNPIENVIPEAYRGRFVEPREWPRHKTGLSLRDWPPAERSAGLTCVTLQGPTDAGKTRLAAFLLDKFSSRGRAWVRAMMIPSLMIEGGLRERQRLEDAAMLVVDELGRAHEGNGWDYVAALVSSRIENFRWTIITTNLEPPDIVEKSPHLWRRLDDAWFIPMHRNWRDR